MRRLFCALLCLTLLLGAPVFCSAEGELTEIRDAAGLLAMAENPSGHYALAADIDLAGLDWTPIVFSGTLDGRGHTLYNLSVTRCGDAVRTARDGNLKPYDTVFAGLFSVLENAEVRDLALRGVHVAVESDRDCFVAALAGCLDHSAVSGCTVEGRVGLVSQAVMVGVGGVAGYGCGSVTACSAELELFFEDRLSDRRCEQFMGGILACGVADVERCAVHLEGYDSCRGYVHNGGLVGMYYLCGMSYPYCSVSENYVGGFIRFFEDNPDRRAYCEPFRGEFLTGLRRYEGNSHDFQRLETFDYSRVLRPESCESPELVEEVTPSGCDCWGFTRHSCRLCGHSWIDSYTPPHHERGEWELAAAPTYAAEGLEQWRCALCGTVTEERSLPALIPTASCCVSGPTTALQPGETVFLSVEVSPADAADLTVRWRSSDESVAVVDADGLLRAVGKGTADITAETADGFCSDSCTVTVRPGLFRWLASLFS